MQFNTCTIKFRLKNLMLAFVVLMSVVSTGYSQGYLLSYFGYFSNEVSFNPMVGHEHEDSVSYSFEVSLDSMSKIKTLDFVLNDSLDAELYHQVVGIQPNADTTGYLANYVGGPTVAIQTPHIFRVLLPRNQMTFIKRVLIRMQLTDDTWINLIHINI